MSGLILIFIIVLWVMTVKKLTRFLTISMPADGFTRLAKVLLFALLLVLPFADEIIGGFQFRALCKQGYTPVFDEAEARGKTVKLKEVSVQILNLKPYLDIPRKDIDYTIIPISEESWEFVDVRTAKTLLSWKNYHAKGGWLSRFIGFPQGAPPYTFNGVCSVHSNLVLLKNLNITVQESGEE